MPRPARALSTASSDSRRRTVSSRRTTRLLRFECCEARQLLTAFPTTELHDAVPADADPPPVASGTAVADEVAPLASGRVAWHSYTAYDDDGTGFRPLDGAIHIYDFALGSEYLQAELTIAASVEHAMNPNFSADGRYLTFMGLPRTRAYNHFDDSWANYLDVFVYDFVTDAVTDVSTRVGRSGFGQVDEDPTFSPDGQWLTFKYQRSDIWAVNLSNYTLRQITARAGEESGPQYSPDGNWIVFWVGSGASAYIARVPADSVRATNYQVVVNNDSVDFPGDTGIQDYFPSYWGSSRIIYTSWDTPQQSGVNDDDDIRILDLTTGANTFAAFDSPYPVDDSDGFGITDSLVGFSKRQSQYWDLWYGDPMSGASASLGIGVSGQHNLGGKYTPLVVYADSVAPAVVARQIGNGSQQRSAIRSLSITFSEDVTLDPGALVLLNQTTELGVTVDPPSYTPGTRTATWTFTTAPGGLLPEGNFTALLTAAKVRDVAGNPLASDETLAFHVLQGDADGNRIVDAADAQIVRDHYLRTHSEGDLNGDGTTNVFDLLMAQQNQGRQLPPAEPVATAVHAEAAPDVVNHSLLDRLSSRPLTPAVRTFLATAAIPVRDFTTSVPRVERHVVQRPAAVTVAHRLPAARPDRPDGLRPVERPGNADESGAETVTKSLSASTPKAVRPMLRRTAGR